MIISIIVAAEENGGIGLNGGIPWRLTDDLKLFRKTTMGHHLIVGRKTFESIGRALPGRKMMVVTSNPQYSAEGCDIAPTLQAALELARGRGETEVFVGGGNRIFAEALPLANRMYFTRVDAKIETDTSFPSFDERDWREVNRTEYAAGDGNEYAFTWRVLERERRD